MKKLLVSSFAFISLLLIHSCTSDENMASENIDYARLLGEKDYIAFESRLIVRDQDAFENLFKKLSGMNEISLNEWEAGIGFKSLRSLHNEMVNDENELLNELLKKYSSEQELTREEIGYAESTRKLLQKGSIFTDKEGIMQLNVTTPVYASLVNDRGIIQIGNKIVKYGRDNVKVIQNGDVSKVKLLNEIEVSDNSIKVYPIQRNVFETDFSARTQALTECSNQNDKYRLLGYEELVSYGEDGTPCSFYLTDYYLTLRMLHKSLGQWWNTNTNEMKAFVSYVANHYDCDGTFNRRVSGTTGSNYTCSFGHTCNIYLIDRYNSGPCTNVSANCNGQPGSVGFSSRYHVIKGKNQTTCNLGR